MDDQRNHDRPGSDGDKQLERTRTAIAEARDGTIAVTNFLRLVVWFLIVISLLWISFGVYYFFTAARPAIQIETIAADFPKTVCPGQDFYYIAQVNVRRVPAVVAVVENFITKDKSRYSVLDATPEWRIVTEPGSYNIRIHTTVPPLIDPGIYTYQRAIGLNNPIIIESPVTIVPCKNGRVP